MASKADIALMFNRLAGLARLKLYEEEEEDKPRSGRKHFNPYSGLAGGIRG